MSPISYVLQLNTTCYRTQTEEDIERDCSKSEPCLVWYAWFLRGKDLVLLEQEEPILNTSMIVPNFSVVYVMHAWRRRRKHQSI